MGISADLIVFGDDGDHIIDDLNSNITLYEFLPEHLHQYVYSSEVEVVDDDYYRDLYQDDTLRLRLWDSEYGIEYISENTSNVIKIPYPIKTAMAPVNSIRANMLGYIGGKDAFIDGIYRIYDSREHFPYLWHIDESLLIMDTVPEWVKSRLIGFDRNNAYIDLGY